MSNTRNYRPKGFHAVTPYLTVPDGNAELRFLAAAFGARELSVHRGDDGALRHAEIQIDDSILEMSQGGGEYPPRPTYLHIYVEDCLATIARAVAAGGKLQYEPGLRFYGDREGGVVDPAGNTWWIATREEHLSDEEMERRTKEQFSKA